MGNHIYKEREKMDKVIRILQWGMHGNTGGVETFLFNLYKNIDKTKVQFDFLIGHNADIAFEKEILDMGGRIYRVTYSKKESLLKAYSELDKFFSEHKEIMGIHMHSCFINYSLPLRLAKKHNIPIRIFHSHNSEDMYPTKSWIKKIYREMERKRIIDNATDLFACSDQAGKYMFKQNKFVWIKNGIDVDKFKFNENIRNIKRKELGIKDNVTVIGFVGRLQYQKNPLFLIDIFYEYSKLDADSKLMVIGEGELSSQMLEKINMLDMKEKVLILEKRHDVHELYQAMDVFLLPSRFEGFGIVALEAQASGLPCLVSDTIPKQVKVTELLHYKGINESGLQWAKVIKQILLKKTDRTIQSKKVKKLFAIDVVADSLVEYYLQHIDK